MTAPASAGPSGPSPRPHLGARVALSPAAKKPATTTGASFMVSNRTQPSDPNDTVPLPDGELNWYLSTVQANDPEPTNYVQQGASQPTVPSTFNSAILTSLKAQANPQITVFIHGLGNLLVPDAYWGTATLGANLVEYGNYPGLVIGFDWPSYDEFDSAYYYASNRAFPPAQFPVPPEPQTIRDNIIVTVQNQAFANFLAFLGDLQQQINGLSVCLVCHSEGNYLAMYGLLKKSPVVLDHVLLVAADINSAAFYQAMGDMAGWGNGIASNATDVTVYFSANDDVLPATLVSGPGGPTDSIQYKYHNWFFGARLGSAGPAYNFGPQCGNMYSVDCSGVVNIYNLELLQAYGVVPVNVDAYPPNQPASPLTLHTSYFFIPQVIADMAGVLTGTAPGDIQNRQATANPGGYYMALPIPQAADKN